VIALLAANLPFLSERVFFVKKTAAKSFWWRLAELVVLYLAVLVLSRALEARAGAVYPQRWEFYAATGCLFLVLGYPGFVWRYLWRKKKT
jgi:hypothetical protein